MLSRSKRHNRTDAAIVFVVTCLLLGSAAPSRADWKVTIASQNVTSSAAPAYEGGSLIVDVSDLASKLGIAAGAQGSTLTLTDAAGQTWQCADGAMALTGPAGARPLSFPAYVRAGVARIALVTLAELAGYQVSIDTRNQVAALTHPVAPEPASTPIPNNAVSTSVAPTPDGPLGWDSFSVAKSTQELARDARLASDSGLTTAQLKPYLPPDFEQMRLSLGVGYVQGADCGFELGASGNYLSTNVNGGALVSQGPAGLRFMSGHVLAYDPAAQRAFEAGDLYSDLAGTVAGLRYGMGSTSAPGPALSLYFPGIGSLIQQTMLALRDEHAISKQVSVGAEVATDGSSFLKTRLLTGPLTLFTYYRGVTDTANRGFGAYAGYNLGHGFGLSGGISRTGVGASLQNWHTVALTFPLRAGIGLTIDRTHNDAVGTASDVTGAGISLPMGRAHLFSRFQWGASSSLDTIPEPVWLGEENRQLTTSAALFSNARGTFNFQSTTRWQQNGASSTFEQVVGAIRLSRFTRIELTSGFPDVTAPNELQMSIEQILSPNESLSLQYGELTPYQPVSQTLPQRGVMLMLRSSWQADTPAAGARVRGAVLDENDRPLDNVRVKLGPYCAITTRDGMYEFDHIPSGAYQFELDDATVPADEESTESPRQLVLDGNSRAHADFHVIPLNAITGRVVLDLPNSKSPRGFQFAVLCLDGQYTTSGPDGQFGFFNMTPGVHTLTLCADRLPDGYAPAGATSTTEALTAERSISGIVFHVFKPDRPIIFQNIDEAPSLQTGASTGVK